MKLKDESTQALGRVYEPGISAAELMEKTGCLEHEAHLYLGHKLFQEKAQVLCEAGISTYQIADILGSNQTQVSRTLRRLRVAAKALASVPPRFVSGVRSGAVTRVGG